MKKLLILLAILIPACIYAATTADKKGGDKQTVVFTVSPRMTCANCENKIKTNLRFEKGVSRIATDLKTQQVTVTYDPAKTDTTQLIKAFGKIGYKAHPKK